MDTTDADHRLAKVTADDLWLELERRGAAIHCGWCYPAQYERSAEDGRTFGQWQHLTLDDTRGAGTYPFRMFARIPHGMRGIEDDV